MMLELIDLWVLKPIQGGSKTAHDRFLQTLVPDQGQIQFSYDDRRLIAGRKGYDVASHSFALPFYTPPRN
jgi:hypothetical protein